MEKFEYKCNICGRIYKSNQYPQHIFICECGKTDIPLYSINLRYCKPTEIENILTHKIKGIRYKWVTKDGREMYVDEMTKTHKENILKLLRGSYDSKNN